MRQYLIATHGTLSGGFLNTLSMISGETSNVTAISAYVENISIEEQAKDFFSKIGEDDEVVVFTDILGGSVNQYFITQLSKKHFHLITGINLPIIITFLYLSDESYLEPSTIESEVENARNQLVYMNEYIKGLAADSDVES